MSVTGTSATDTQPLQFVWLEITGKCQLSCVHCYADSGPSGDHGMMAAADWERVIDEVAGMGVAMVQFIGGEPTLHRSLPALVARAVRHGIEVEVFTNLVHVTPALWETFTMPGVRLATSWYSDDPQQHHAVTGRSSHARTTANIAEAVRRSIPLRVGIIGVHDGQRVDEARRVLTELGVDDVGYDRLRQVGRGVRTLQADPSQLCGQCASGNVAVAADGTVWPCVFARWLPIGNVGESPLATVVAGPKMGEVAAYLRRQFGPREMPCVPKMCDPQCGPSCSPACRPRGDCRPAGGCAPKY